MDKRALAAVPRPALTDKNREMLLLVPYMCYLVTASRQEVEGADTLIINFFRRKGGQLNPAFRTFCQMDGYITQDLATDKTKWKTGSIDHLTGYLYWHRNEGNIVIASVEERGMILGFLYDFKKMYNICDCQKSVVHGRQIVDTEITDLIDEYQQQIKEWKLQVKHMKEKEWIDRQMEKFGELPGDYQEFIRGTVFEKDNYIFFNYEKKEAYCSKCGFEFELTADRHLRSHVGIWNEADKIKHNLRATCPHCGELIACKSEGMGRKKLFAVRWSVLVQKYGEDVLVRYFCHTKDFQGDFRKPQIESREKFRTVHTAGCAMDFEWGRFKSTQDVRWCVFKDRRYGYYSPSEMEAPRQAVLYNRNLRETVAGTCMKYSAVDIYMDKVVHNGRLLVKPWCIDWYFNSYRKAPYLEQLLKVGFFEIARSALEDHDCPEFEDGNTILEILGINKIQFNMLRKVGDPRITDLRILKYAGELRWEEFEVLRYIPDNTHSRIYEKYIDMRRYTTVYKVEKYLCVQQIACDRDYFDYIRWIEEMGYDMRNEFNLYPKDFRKSHDEKYKEYIRFKDKREQEARKRFDDLLKKMKEKAADVDAVNLKLRGMFIRTPYNLDELKLEGEALHHCVGSYIDRVAKGETMIFFIRKTDEPDKPFFTLEWKGRVVQCRGNRNCSMTAEVKAFVGAFEKAMAEYERKPAKQRRAG